LLLVENDWKALISKNKYEDEHIKRLFLSEMEVFKTTFDKSFYPQSHEKHKQVISKFGSEKCKVFCKNLLPFLQEKKSLFLHKFNWLEYNKNLDEIINDTLLNITAYDLFKDIVKICMKKAYDNKINFASPNSNDDILENSFLHVHKHHVM
jgi:hypothetical protein